MCGRRGRFCLMDNEGSSVTLILYAIDKRWWAGGEPLLNLVAAAAQFSSFTHVELAIGEAAGENGKMANVLRVFNDAVGVVSHPAQCPSSITHFLSRVCVC